jgi:hypothetical protein
MQRPKILHSKFLFESCDDPLDELRRGSCEYNVVNIEEQIDSFIATAVDE